MGHTRKLRSWSIAFKRCRKPWNNFAAFISRVFAPRAGEERDSGERTMGGWGRCPRSLSEKNFALLALPPRREKTIHRADDDGVGLSDRDLSDEIFSLRLSPRAGEDRSIDQRTMGTPRRRGT